jgi:hypothetical protein
MIFIVSISSGLVEAKIVISPQEIQKLGQQIYRNECGGKITNLICWKTGEKNLSLGIGHFIWYPETVNIYNQFDQQFPKLLQFLQEKKVMLPQWLSTTQWCPWHSKQEWEVASSGKQAQELQMLLEKTISLQAEFIVINFLNNCEKLFFDKSVEQQFTRMITTSSGIYALIDYANFKGFGFDQRERYNGQGWGLYHVFLHMMQQKPSNNSLQDFVASAKHILALRVEHAPIEKDEKRWLQGWYNRLDTYLK